MKNLLLALLAASMPCAASAANRSTLGEGAAVIPTVALPQAAIPGLPGAGLSVSGVPALPSLPAAAAPAALPAAPAAGPVVAAPAAAAAQAAGPKASAAQPQLEKLGAALSGAQEGPKSSSGMGASAAAVDGALSSAFDGARIEHACAHCAHLVGETPADEGDFPQDEQGNPFIVPGHLDPLLPSHVDPKTWTNRITLHLHSIFSDGTMTPEAVMDLAYAKGVRIVALSDHDTTAGLVRAWTRAKQLGMEFHPAVEMTAQGGVHIGAVDVDVTNPKLVALLERVRVMRYAKAAGMVKNLNELPELKAKGITLTIDEVKAKSMYDQGGTIEIPHIARVLVDKGLIAHVDDAYQHYLHGDVFKVPGVEPDPTVDEVVEAIRAAGGKAFLNHPYTVRAPNPSQQDAAINKILDKGLDGIEVYRPVWNTPEGRKITDARAAKYLTWADQRSLLAGNGADFHGTDTHLDNLEVWMPNVLASQLTGALKDANARATAALERAAGSQDLAAKPAVPPTPGKLSALALAPLAFASGEQAFHFPWLALVPAGFLMALSVFAMEPWFKTFEKKHPNWANVILGVCALGFAASVYGLLLARVSGWL